MSDPQVINAQNHMGAPSDALSAILVSAEGEPRRVPRKPSNRKHVSGAVLCGSPLSPFIPKLECRTRVIHDPRTSGLSGIHSSTDCNLHSFVRVR